MGRVCLRPRSKNSLSLRFMASFKHRPVTSTVLSSGQTSPSKAPDELEAKDKFMEKEVFLWRWNTLWGTELMPMCPAAWPCAVASLNRLYVSGKRGQQYRTVQRKYEDLIKDYLTHHELKFTKTAHHLYRKFWKSSFFHTKTDCHYRPNFLKRHLTLCHIPSPCYAT